MSAAALRHQGPNNRIWGLSAAAAAALHLAAAGAALLTLVGEPEDEDTGAPAIEISLAPAAPQVEDSTDAPPGPESEAVAAAAPAVAASETKDSDDPKIARTDAEDADYSFAEKHEKPVEDPAQREAKPVASAEVAPSEARSPPKSEVDREAPQAVASAQGVDKAARVAKLEWQKRLAPHVRAHLQYPRGVPKRDAEVLVKFTLDRVGHIVEAHVDRSSGDPAFDAAALATMKRADPMPPPPPAIADERLSFNIPVQFGRPQGRR